MALAKLNNDVRLHLMTFLLFALFVVMLMLIGYLYIFIPALVQCSTERIIAAIKGLDAQKEAQLTQELKQSADALQSGIDSNKQIKG